MLIGYQSSKNQQFTDQLGSCQYRITEGSFIPYTHQSSTRMSNDLLSIPCVLMRGGTSKFFLASDLPADTAERDRLLLEVMGSAIRCRSGTGGNAPTAWRSSTARAGRTPTDYLFAQVRGSSRWWIPRPTAATCWRPWARMPSMWAGARRIRRPRCASTTVETPGGNVAHRGDTRIAGAPGSAAPVGSPSLMRQAPAPASAAQRACAGNHQWRAGQPGGLRHADDAGACRRPGRAR